MSLEAAGRRVKFLYTVPNYHNPAGVTLSAERRPQIVEICHRHGVLILEDNPYGLLGFDREPLPALRSLSPEGVIYLGSFSKTFRSGLSRWLGRRPARGAREARACVEAAIISPSNMSQMAISSYLDHFDWQGQDQGVPRAVP